MLTESRRPGRPSAFKAPASSISVRLDHTTLGELNAACEAVRAAARERLERPALANLTPHDLAQLTELVGLAKANQASVERTQQRRQLVALHATANLSLYGLVLRALLAGYHVHVEPPEDEEERRQALTEHVIDAYLGGAS